MSHDALIDLRIGAATTDREVSLALPIGWKPTVCLPAVEPRPLDAEEIASRITGNEGRSIREAAQGARTAVILVDDFSRPTPVAQLAPLVMDQLNAAGISDEMIEIVIGAGCHQPMDRHAVEERLGAAASRAGRAGCHYAYSPSVVFKGLTSRGTPVLVHDRAAKADFSIAIGSVYPHNLTAWGGGAKLVLPGIAHASSIFFHHNTLGAAGRRGADPDSSHARQDVEEAGRLFGLDMAVCCVLDLQKRLCGLHVGGPTTAHRAAVAEARPLYLTPVGDLKPDIVIASLYPYDSDYAQLPKIEWTCETFGAPVIAIADFCTTSAYHGLYDGSLPAFRRNLPDLRQRRMPENLDTAKKILFCPQNGEEEFAPHRGNWACTSNWQDLMKRMAIRYPNAKVAVFPAAPLQLPEPNRIAGSNETS